MADQADEPIVEEEEEATEVEEDSVEEEAPVRKSASFYAQRRIIEKQGKKIEKLEKGEKDEDFELTPSAQDLIRKEISPVVEALKSQQDELELRQYLSDHPEHKKFEKAARKRMGAWSNVPVEDIFKTLTFGSEQKVKEEKKGEAIVRAKSATLKGSSARAEETSLPSTQEDFKKIYDKIKRDRQSIKLGE